VVGEQDTSCLGAGMAHESTGDRASGIPWLEPWGGSKERFDEWGTATVMQEWHLPVLFKQSYAVTQASIECFPDLILIIPHPGMLNGGPTQVLDAFADRPHIHWDIDLSAMSSGVIKKLAAHRLVVDSDWPYDYPEESLARVPPIELDVGTLDGPAVEE